MITVEWRRFPVIMRESRDSSNTLNRDFYEAWKPGFPNLNAYGKTLNEAVSALFNKWGRS